MCAASGDRLFSSFTDRAKLNPGPLGLKTIWESLLLRCSHLRPPCLCSSRNLSTGSSRHFSTTPNGPTKGQSLRNTQQASKLLFQVFDAFLYGSSLLEL